MKKPHNFSVLNRLGNPHNLMNINHIAGGVSLWGYY